MLPVVLEDGADFEAYKPRPKLNTPATLARIGSPTRIWVVLPYIPSSADAAADLELALLRRYRLVPKGTYGGVRVHLLVPRKSLSTQPLTALTAK